ncbi:MAG: 50S ribosomal protein L10 [Eggerthellaceae bacterium]
MFSSDDSHPRGAEPEFEKKEVYYMPNAKNQEMLTKIKGDLDGVSAVWVVDYCGLTVKDIQALRTAIRESVRAEAVREHAHAHRPESRTCPRSTMLAGPSAPVFAGDDVAAAAKAVKTFAKTNKNLEIKGGLMEGAQVSAAQVEAIASLPSREELLAQIAGAISGVASGLMLPSTACRAVLLRSRRLWLIRKKLLKRSAGSVMSAA